MSYIDDVVMRTARYFKISEERARVEVSKIVEEKLAEAARKYIGGAELEGRTVSQLLADRLDLAPPLAPVPELPKTQAKAK